MTSAAEAFEPILEVKNELLVGRRAHEEGRLFNAGGKLDGEY